jgi:hypothetical protein
MHKGYKCLDRSTGQIYISCDVAFHETSKVALANARTSYISC